MELHLTATGCHLPYGSDRAGLRSAASSAVAVPRTMSSFGDRSFAVAGPRAWNKLPLPLRHVDSAVTFKRQLKTFLFDNAFNSHC